MFFEVVDEFEVHFDVLVMVEGQGRDKAVEVLDEVAEDRDLVLFLNQIYGRCNQPFLQFVVAAALVDER